MDRHSNDFKSKYIVSGEEARRPKGILFIDYRPLDMEGWKSRLVRDNAVSLERYLADYERKNAPHGLKALISGNAFRKALDAERRKLEGFHYNSEASLKSGLDGLLKAFSGQPYVLNGDGDGLNSEYYGRPGRVDFIVVGAKAEMDGIADYLATQPTAAPVFLRQLFDPSKCKAKKPVAKSPDFDKDPFKYTEVVAIRDFRAAKEGYRHTRRQVG